MGAHHVPNNHYAKVSGTSFSSPLVAGGAALLVDLNGTNEAAADVAFSCRASARNWVRAGWTLPGLLSLSREISRQ